MTGEFPLREMKEGMVSSKVSEFKQAGENVEKSQAWSDMKGRQSGRRRTLYNGDRSSNDLRSRDTGNKKGGRKEAEK